jgi:hypothetical protein
MQGVPQKILMGHGQIAKPDRSERFQLKVNEDV